MPLYAMSGSTDPEGPESDSGVMPVTDKNAPTPKPEDAPVDQPDFLEQWITQLAQVRIELSAIMAQDMSCCPPMGGNYKRPTVADKENDIQSQITRQQQKVKLEAIEESLVGQINNFLYVASMRTTPDVKSPPPEPDTDEAMPMKM